MGEGAVKRGKCVWLGQPGRVHSLLSVELETKDGYLCFTLNRHEIGKSGGGITWRKRPDGVQALAGRTLESQMGGVSAEIPGHIPPACTHLPVTVVTASTVTSATTYQARVCQVLC